MTGKSTAGSDTGFTLIELLVALFVTAIMFALGYGAITQALENREQVRAQQTRINDVQRAMRLMVQDFSQTVPRPVRDVLGNGSEEALRADPRVATLVSLTRGGNPNLAGAQRPTLQRIDYTLEAGVLWRQAWPVLDRTQSSPPLRRELLSNLRTVRFRFMDASRSWLDQWPPAVAPSTPAGRLRMRPIAVEITLESEDLGVLTRLVEVAG